MLGTGALNLHLPVHLHRFMCTAGLTDLSSLVLYELSEVTASAWLGSVPTTIVNPVLPDVSVTSKVGL